MGPKGEDLGYLTTFRGINPPKSGPFKYENNAQTLLKQLQNNFEKVQKSTFLTPQNGQKRPLKSAKMSKILTQNLSFQGHLSTFEVKKYTQK